MIDMMQGAVESKRMESIREEILSEEEMDSEVVEAAKWLKDRINESRDLGDDELISFNVIMGPKVAAYILNEYNKGNRGITTERVKEFMGYINNGEWKFMSQGMSFSRCGILNNGQHRLMAIVATGISVPIYMTFGEDRAVFDVLDTHRPRGGRDALDILGKSYTSTLSAAATMLTRIKKEVFYSQFRLSNSEVLKVVLENPKLEENTAIGSRLGSKFRCSGAALTVGFYLIGTQSKKKDKEAKLVYFLDKLDTGLMDEPGPILLLRDGLSTKKVDHHVRHSRQKSLAQAAAVVKAWNSFVNRRKGTLSALRWDPTQPFPIAE